MSSRSRVLDVLRRFRALPVYLIAALAGLSVKNTERILASLRREGKVRSHPWKANRRLYALTPDGAARLGLDPRRYQRPPGGQALGEALLVAAFCAEFQQTLLLPSEFVNLMPTLGECPGHKHRFYIDTDGMLTLLVLDFGLRPRELARKARKAIETRRAFEPWKRRIFTRNFRVVVVTASGERKAERVRKHLRNDTFPHAVVSVVLGRGEYLARPK